MLHTALLLLFWLCMTLPAWGQQLAFPTAEGFGRFSQGGRGGRAYLINSLSSANGTGGSCNAGGCSGGTITLRDCLKDRFGVGARTCIFRIGGIIDWPCTDFQCNESASWPDFLTIAGQTAPGDGIVIKRFELQFRDMHDVIVRHLRVYPGADALPEFYTQHGAIEALGSLQETYNIIIDHSTLVWAPDDTAASGGNIRNLTWQWNVIGEGLGFNVGSSADNAKCGIQDTNQSTGGISYHHNYLPNSWYRCPNAYGGYIQVVNNLYYNNNAALQVVPRHNFGVMTEFVNNYIRPGPNTQPGEARVQFLGCGYPQSNCTGAAASRTQLSGNIHTFYRPNLAEPESDYLFITGSPQMAWQTGSLNLGFPVIATQTTAVLARDAVLAKAGARVPTIDSVTQRQFNDWANFTGRANILDEDNIGGYPTYNSGTPYPDADTDGMSDTWETANGLNPANPADGPAIAANGYSNLENFINELAGDTPPVYYVSTTGSDAVSCASAQNIGTPKRTVTNAITCLSPGATLYIRAGTYVEDQITIPTQCTAALPCTIAGFPGDARPVLRPPAPPAYTGLGGVIFFYAGAGSHDSYVTLRDLDVDAINLPVGRMGIWVQMAHVTLDNLTVSNAPRNAIYLAGDSTAYANFTTIRNTRMLDCGRIQTTDDYYDTKGLGVYSSSANVLIEHNLVDGCRGGGFEINYGTNINTVVRNNVVRNSGADSPWGPEATQPTWGRCFGLGLSWPGESTTPHNTQVYNNVCYNMHGANGGTAHCINFTGSTNTIFANNTCYNMDHPYFILGSRLSTGLTFQNNLFAGLGNTSPIGNTANLSGAISNNLYNPTVADTFVNAAGGDFHIKAGSPALNTGVTVAAVPNDFEGTLRPQDGVYDIGADELGAGSVADITSNLVAHWPFNQVSGAAVDATGNGHTGTLMNGASYTLAGRIANGIALNGTTQFVEAADAATLDITGAYTLSAWVFPTNSLSDFASVVVKNYTYYLYAGSEGVCGVGAVLGGHATNHHGCHATPLTANVWTHLAVTNDGTTVRLYRNGVEVATDTSGAAPTATTGTLTIGSSQFGEFFPGVIDDVRLYSRALTAFDIATLHTTVVPGLLYRVGTFSGGVSGLSGGISK